MRMTTPYTSVGISFTFLGQFFMNNHISSNPIGGKNNNVRSIQVSFASDCCGGTTGVGTGGFTEDGCCGSI
jgi:hypothetical protein